jgi:hypothetical protein
MRTVESRKYSLFGRMQGLLTFKLAVQIITILPKGLKHKPEKSERKFYV